MQTSQTATASSPASRYAKPVELSKRVRFDIDRDVFRGITRAHWLGDQRAVEALVRFTDEELKHQEMFRRLELMVAEGMPVGYRFVPEANAVASVVLGKSTWAVLALTCHIEVFVLSHYRQSIAADPALSPLFKDVMLHHWREESQHVIIDELEWDREDAAISAAARNTAVDEFIELIGAVDGIVQAQAALDSRYFASTCGRELTTAEAERVSRALLGAYRWQYILSGASEPRFMKALAAKITSAQMQRIERALAPLAPRKAA